MYASSQRSTRPNTSRGPAMYFGYCQRSRQYRMMDLPEYVDNVQEGMSRMMNEGAAAYEGMMRNYGGGAAAGLAGPMTRRHERDCGCGCRGRDTCNDCHCECCVCDADVLVHARCGEVRRIPLTFENDTRRDRPVTLELGKFVTSGGRDLGWAAQLSETKFTLRPCDEHTVTLLVAIRCETEKPSPDSEPNPGSTRPEATITAVRPDSVEGLNALAQRFGRVDRCEVGYATIRAEGCLTRPVVVAIAVLPDDCDAYRHPCGCNCCH